MNSLEQFGGIGAMLMIFGAYLKNMTDIPNKYIPYILPAFGILANCILAGWTPVNALFGLLTSLTATGIHSTVKHAVEKPKTPIPNNEEDKKP